MNQVARVLSSLFLLTGSAAADDAPGVEAGTAEPPVRFTRDVISRVLTFPAGVGQAGFDLNTSTSAAFDPATIRILAGYGITDDLEVNFGHYQFATNDAGGGSIDLGLGYKLLRGAAGGKLEVIGRAQTGYSMSTESMTPLLLGAHAQYNITPKVCVLTPGGQLAVGLEDPNPIALNLPVGVGFQATPELYLQLDTRLATVNLKDTASAYLFADTTPVALTATYNVIHALDLNAGLALDLTPPEVEPGMDASVGDTLTVLVGARYYLGRL